jgi:hypothetical protein
VQSTIRVGSLLPDVITYAGSLTHGGSLKYTYGIYSVPYRRCDRMLFTCNTLVLLVAANQARQTPSQLCLYASNVLKRSIGY